jgi:hypothetical protein
VTKIQAHFRLDGPLDDKQFEQIRDVQAVYGIERVSLSRSLDSLTVEYDATRLTPLDVESLLRRHGLPVTPQLVA